jgi:hypothetical protein
MNIGFTGTSRRMLSTKQKEALREILERRPKARLIHGGAVGADDYADELAASLHIDRVVFPASNVKSCQRVPEARLRSRTGSTVTIMPARPALERNKDIVHFCDILLAMPGQATAEMLRSGTWSTVRYARKHWHNDPDRIKLVIP